MTPRRERLAEALACVLPYREEIDGTPAEHVAAWARRLRDGGGVLARGVEWEFGGAPEVTPWAITDVREAWEALATRLDLAGAVAQPRREFACAQCGGDGMEMRQGWPDALPCTGCGGDPRRSCAAGAGTFAHPPTVAACVALAADWPGVLTAEAIARELTGADRVVWRVGQATTPVASPPLPRLSLALDAQREATRAGARGAAPGSPQARAADLLALGYAIERVTHDAVVLLAPGLGTRARSERTHEEDRT